jgi:hypothetical protein
LYLHYDIAVLRAVHLPALESAADGRAASTAPGAELYRRRMSELQKLLSDEVGRDEAGKTVRALIERIEMHARNKRARLR